jgi:hypothetical protein
VLRITNPRGINFNRSLIGITRNSTRDDLFSAIIRTGDQRVFQDSPGGHRTVDGILKDGNHPRRAHELSRGSNVHKVRWITQRARAGTHSPCVTMFRHEIASVR